MKTWFIYLIDGKRVATWANNCIEARNNLRKEYGSDICMDFVGIDWHLGHENEKADEYCYSGMSCVDFMIASGILDALSRI